MCVRLMGTVFDSQLPLAMKMVALSMANYANPDGQNIYPSVRRLVADSSLTERHVRKVLAALRDIGIISEIAPASTRKPTTYSMSKEALLAYTPVPGTGVSDEQGGPVLGTGIGLSQEPRIPVPGTGPSITVTEPSERTKTLTVNARELFEGQADSITIEFKVWYQGYPLKKDPDAALRAYRKARKSASAKELLEGRDRYIQEKQAEGSTFYKYPATWLNAGAWKSETSPLGIRNELTPEQARQIKSWSALRDALARAGISMDSMDAQKRQDFCHRNGINPILLQG